MIIIGFFKIYSLHIYMLNYYKADRSWNFDKPKHYKHGWKRHNHVHLIIKNYWKWHCSPENSKKYVFFSAVVLIIFLQMLRSGYMLCKSKNDSGVKHALMYLWLIFNCKYVCFTFYINEFLKLDIIICLKLINWSS